MLASMQWGRHQHVCKIDSFDLRRLFFTGIQWESGSVQGTLLSREITGHTGDFRFFTQDFAAFTVIPISVKTPFDGFSVLAILLGDKAFHHQVF